MKELIEELRRKNEDGTLAEITENNQQEAADALERLTRGDVALPEHDHLINSQGMFGEGFTAEAMIDYGDRRAAAAVLADEALMRECLEALQWEVGGEPCNGQQIINKLKARLGEK
jgi:hypothetical protein